MGRRVLMIEDDETIASMYRIRLEAEDWEVHVARTGEVGIKLATSLRPDAVILDVMLPGIDGIEVLRRLRASEASRDLRVVVLSNSAGLPESADEARRLGIVEWLVKSRVSPSELVERLEAVVPG
jgi:DNA-binding response OmpR family regulator